ncbi:MULTISPECIES: LysM peptidoglycan-binding domain-containing protein [Micrococcaceae]|uniref:LysM peptidoglycan-binding domain-containing protein n=1 Tax=unclassified Kocuria TaxID=2649579 RepID=UPI001EE12EAE|nr:MULTISPECIES: LysM peptidoglycan-binding domain-containing protein [unclassified Kocuria]
MRTVLSLKNRDTEWIRRPEATPSKNSPMTLTRRGRFVFFGLPLLSTVIIAAALLMMFFAAGTANAGTESAGVVTKTVTVGSGDTLWDIARDVDPSGDTREAIAKINDLNDLSSGRVTPGQRLIVPVISEG